MPSYDLAVSLGLFGALALALGAHLVASLAHGHPLVASRVEREAGLPLVGRAPMHAVYRAMEPIGRALVLLHVTANAITIASAVIALLAAAAFASGHFGVAAGVAVVASMADGLDGFVARLTNTQSRFGQVLDTTVDRYVDAMFLGGIALFVHEDLILLAATLLAIIGSFMVSYASSVERELGVSGPAAPMRRSHRLVFLLLAAALAPIGGYVLGPRAELPILFSAVAAIGLVGNVSAVRRLLRAAPPPPPEPAREPATSEGE